MTDVPGILVVRRSIHIAAPPEQILNEFASFDRMKRWWGVVLAAPRAGTPNGQRLLTYDPRLGGRIEMEVELDGSPASGRRLRDPCRRGNRTAPGPPPQCLWCRR